MDNIQTKAMGNIQYNINFDQHEKRTSGMDKTVLLSTEAENERMIWIVEDILWRTIRRNTRMLFDALQEVIKKETQKEISRCELGAILWIINERAWALHKCLPSSYVLWYGGLPGKKFFTQVQALKALPGFIAHMRSKRKAVEYFQDVAHRVVCQIM